MLGSVANSISMPRTNGALFKLLFATFATPGTFSWVSPYDCNIDFFLQAGGGAGGNFSQFSGAAAGGGAGGIGRRRLRMIAGQSINFTIGAGAVGRKNNSGFPGNQSTVTFPDSSTGTVLPGSGGGQNSAASNALGGAGGSGSGSFDEILNGAAGGNFNVNGDTGPGGWPGGTAALNAGGGGSPGSWPDLYALFEARGGEGIRNSNSSTVAPVVLYGAGSGGVLNNSGTGPTPANGGNGFAAILLEAFIP